MVAVMIDTLAASEQLVDAGIPAEHARAIARLLSGAQVAAREDLATKGDMIALRTELRTEMATLSIELRSEIKTLNAELKADMVRWLFGSQLLLVVALAGLMAFFKHFG